MQIGQEILLEIPLTGPITVEITKTDGFLPGKLFWLEVEGAIPKAQGYVDEVWMMYFLDFGVVSSLGGVLVQVQVLNHLVCFFLGKTPSKGPVKHVQISLVHPKILWKPSQVPFTNRCCKASATKRVIISGVLFAL